MNVYIQSILLGIVEGLTEFLPVSSTAHLRISEALMHIPLDDAYWKMYTIVIQLGAILTLPVYFRERIAKFLRTFPEGERGDRTLLTHPLSLVMIAFGELLYDATWSSQSRLRGWGAGLAMVAALGAAATIAMAALYRALSLRALRAALEGTVAVSGMILFIILGATVFSQILSFSGVTDGVVSAVTGRGLSPFFILLSSSLICGLCVKCRLPLGTILSLALGRNSFTILVYERSHS